MIPLFKVHMPRSVLEPLSATLLSGYIGQGSQVAAFENALGAWVSNERVLTTNSGTSAIHLALRLAGVGTSTEVISTPMTCVATNAPILERGADIVWSDIDPWTGNIDPESVRARITPRTKAVVAVHWGGYPCDLDTLGSICHEHNIALVEDAAHAFGALYRGKAIGSQSDYVCFSFQAIKHLTTVDGGAVTTKTPESFARGKLLRWYGIDRDQPRRDFRCEEDIKDVGYKFHMNDVAATIGLEQLRYVGHILAAHRENASYYEETLKDLRRVRLLRFERDRLSSYWLFTLRVKDRPSFIDFMASRGIMCSQVHARNDVHTAFQAFRASLPGVDEFAEEQVSIPVGWWVTPSERESIREAITTWDNQ